MMLRPSILAAVAVLASTSFSPAGSPDFPGRWAQVSSTGGDCPTCALSINRSGERIEMEASNGWTAELASTGQREPRSAMGTGTWPTWGARPVRILLLLDETGDLILQMAIRHPDGGQQMIHAVYRREPTL